MKPCEAPFKRAQPALGTFLELTLEAPDRASADASMSLAFAEARRLEGIFSFFDPASELARLNRAARDEELEVSAELGRVLGFAIGLEDRSRRAFRLLPACDHDEPCRWSLAGDRVLKHGPCPADLGGIAKGHVVDRIAELLRHRHPGARAVVNAGGDLRCSGTHWIEIRVPTTSGGAGYRLSLTDEAVATSSCLGTAVGAGSPSALFPRPAGTAKSATVIATSCMVADAMTKVALFGDARAASEPGVSRVLGFSASGDEIGAAS